MSEGIRAPFGEANHLALNLRATLAPACERIEIAGSLRRERPTVGDVELVAIPRMVTEPVGMFESREVSALDAAVDSLIADGALIRLSGGDRYIKLQHVGSGLQVDLFVVRPPAQWGMIYLIRTGPAAYSQRFVTDIKPRFHVAGGALHRGGGFGCPDRCAAIETPEEEDVYSALGQAYIEPWARDRLAALGGA